MAGSGRRTFAAGEVLTASNVMNYLQDQAVMVFAGTAARGSAIGTAVAEGMVSYLKDTNDVEVYTGSLWEGLGPKGRIAQVVFGSTSTQVNNTTTTYVDSGLTATITPKFSTSKIVVLVSQNGIFKNGTNPGYCSLRMYKDATSLAQLSVYSLAITPNTSELDIGSISGSYVETSGSLTARTYKTMYSNANATGNVFVQAAGAVSTITILEITA